MELNTIQTEGTWNDVAERLNDNFRKINLAIENGTGGGGEGGTVSEELLEQVANNTTNISKNTDNIGTLKTRVDVLYANESTTGSVQNRIKKALEDYVAKEDGKGLSTEDFTTALKSKLEGLTNYDDTTISNAVNQLQGTLNTLLHSDPNEAINSFNEIIKFLEGVKDSENLDSIIASIEQQIADKYTKPSGGIPVSDLETNVQASLQKADVAIQPNDIYSKTELDTKFGEKLGKEENAASARKIVGFTENPTLDVKIKDGLLEVFKNSNNAQGNPTSYGSGLTLLTAQGGFQIAVHNQISSKNLRARVIGFNEAYTDWKELAYIDDVTEHLDSKIDKKGGEISGSLVHVVSSTGGDAVGYEYKTKDGERIAGFGAYSHKGNLIHTYIGFGSEPWGTYNGLNVGENTFTYKGKAIWYSGQEITESVKISTGSDNKIVLNNTDGDTKYSFILFMDKGEEYGRLGTNGTSELRWNNNIILDSNNYTTYVLTKEEIQALLDGKQPYIENLTTIIANAEKGATALQPDDVYTKEEMKGAIALEVTEQTRDFITRSDVKESYALKTDVDKKQAQLVSGTNIKTLNGQSILGAGDITISVDGKEVLAAPTSGGVAQFSSSNPLLPDKIYLSDAPSGLFIDSITPPSGPYAEYIVFFAPQGSSIVFQLPSGVMWKDGKTPTIESGKHYKLSIYAVGYKYMAEITVYANN